MEDFQVPIRKVRLAVFTEAENDFILSSNKVKEYFECKHKKDKLKVAALIEADMKKSGRGLSRDANEISRRLDNLKMQYKVAKKQEECCFLIQWQYYEKMKKIME